MFWHLRNTYTRLSSARDDYSSSALSSEGHKRDIRTAVKEGRSTGIGHSREEEIFFLKLMVGELWQKLPKGKLCMELAAL